LRIAAWGLGFGVWGLGSGIGAQESGVVSPLPGARSQSPDAQTPSRIVPPLAEAYRLRFCEPFVILQARHEPPGRRLADVALIYHGGQIEALEPATGRPLWHSKVDDALQPLWLGEHEGLLLFATPFQVFAIDRLSGGRRWTFGRIPPRADSPAVDPEELRRLADHAWGNGKNLVSIYEDGRAIGLRVADGHELWRHRLEDPYRGPADMNDQYLAYASPADPPRRAGAIVVIRTATGRSGAGDGESGRAGDREISPSPPPPLPHSPALVRRIERTDDRQVTWLRFTRKGLLAAGSDWVAAYEPATGELLWEMDPLPRNHVAAMRVTDDVLYLCPGREVLALSLAHGEPRWRSERSAGQDEPLAATWVDLGDFFVVSSHTVESFEASTGSRRWALRLPPDLTVALPVLTARSIMTIGVDTPTDAGSPRRVRACFIDRYFGGPSARGGELCTDLLKSVAVPGLPQVRAFGQAVLVRDDQTLIGYVNATVR
jgi:hypothetical protein